MRLTFRALPACLALALLLLVSGCPFRTGPGIPAECIDATVITPLCFDALYARYQGYVQAGVQIATGLYLAQFPARGPHMYDTLQTIEARLGAEELTTLATLEALVRDTVNWSALEPGIRLAIEGLLTTVRTTLEIVLRDLRVTEPTQIRLVARDMIRWTIAAVVIQCPTCRQQAARELQP